MNHNGSPLMVGLAVTALIGLVLWGMGRKIARPGYALSGLLSGVVFALAIPQARQNTQTLLVAIFVASLIGLLLAWLLFRVATGLTLAVTLAVVLPAAELVWQSDHFPQFPDISIQARSPRSPHRSPRTSHTRQPPQTSADTAPDASVEIPSNAAEISEILPPEVLRFHEEIFKINKMTDSMAIPSWAADQPSGEIIKQWFEQFDSAARRSTIILALSGAVLGLFIGLVAPYWAVSGQTALVGSGMMLVSAHHLLPRLSGSLSNPLIDTPQQGLILLGLITFAGIGFQWIVWRKKADR